MTGSTWIWRPTSPGYGNAVCARCGTSYHGTDQEIHRQEAAHDPGECATRALTPQARRLRGAR